LYRFAWFAIRVARNGRGSAANAAGIPLVVRNKQLADFSREISKMVAEARSYFAKSPVEIVNSLDKLFNISAL